jgi:hypothetical protein
LHIGPSSGAINELDAFEDARQRVFVDQPTRADRERAKAWTRILGRDLFIKRPCAVSEQCVVAQRIEHGDTVQTLTEDYPHIPAEAFQTAYTYAKAHPRRGRPTPPWQDGDEALDRRGPLPVTG